MNRADSPAAGGQPPVTSPEPADGPVLEVVGLSIARVGDREPLVAGVSFTLAPGQVGVVAGRSGAGKSLLFQAILGLLPAEGWRLEGEIVFRGRPLLSANGYRWDELERALGRKIMAVFQEPGSHLHPSLTVGWQLREMWRPAAWGLDDEAESRARDLLERVALAAGEEGGYLGRYPFQLSRGQQQRVMIAMALSGADLLLADEPTSALDPETESGIVRLLAGLRERGLLRSLLLIAHDLEPFGELLEPGDWLLRIELEGGRGRALPARRLGEAGLASPLPGEPPAVPAPSAHLLLRVEELALRLEQGLWRRPATILEGVSFEVLEGELFAVSGPSGSGKTTLARALAGLLPAASGKIGFRPRGREDLRELDGRAFTDPEIRRQIQIVFQDALGTMNPRMTLGETFHEILRYGGTVEERERSERIALLLAELGLADGTRRAAEVLERFPAEFSGGQRQRLGVARALLLEPRLVIADEPFASQDIETSLEMVELFRRLQGEHGITFVLISHDRLLLGRLCRRGAELRDGSLSAVAAMTGSGVATA